MKILVVVDMQKDFVDGALGTKEAEVIVPAVADKINEFRKDKNSVIVFTKDTHYNDYMETLEGKKLPVPHCIFDSEGWEITSKIKVQIEDIVITKETFGYKDWSFGFNAINFNPERDTIEICGLCTDICVISNALILRALYPNVPITVDAKCCAGVTPEKHLAALEVMKSCQIDVINE